MNHKRHRILSALSTFFILLFLFLGILLSKASTWAIQAFGNVTIDEIIFHLKVPLQGTDKTSIVSFIHQALFPAIKASVLVVLIYLLPYLERYLRNKYAQYTGKQITLVIQRNPLCTIYQNEAYLLPKFSKRICSFIVVVVLIVEFCGISKTYALNEYIQQQISPSTWIENNYVSPAEVNIIWPVKKRNLIYIFLESMESSYASSADGGYYTENLIPELTELALGNINFSNKDTGIGGATSIPCTGWTVAGMFAQTSGLPLKLPVEGNSMDSYSTFFPGVTSLGQLLQAEGYNNYIMFGSDKAFAGRGNYFSQHGDYEVEDYNWAAETGRIPQEYSVFWGFEDNRLFNMAEEKLLEIAGRDEPFNLTLLTVDTHFPDGYRCELCQNEHDTDYKDALSCSSRQVYHFIQWIQQQDFYKDTTIIISGDHLTMSAAINAEISSDYQRTIYNCIINSAVEPVSTTNRTFSTIDMYPTTLAALGCKIDGDRLALGTNLFSNRETLLEEYGYETTCDEISKRSSFYNSLMY